MAFDPQLADRLGLKTDPAFHEIPASTGDLFARYSRNLQARLGADARKARREARLAEIQEWAETPQSDRILRIALKREQQEARAERARLEKKLARAQPGKLGHLLAQAMLADRQPAQGGGS